MAIPCVTKLFHFARFDIAMIYHYLGVMAAPVYCTKIASRLARTFTDRHGLRDLCKDLSASICRSSSKARTGARRNLTDEQLRYAASDVLYLHALRGRLDAMLAREGRAGLAQRCFAFLPHRVLLDLGGWAEQDIFAH